MPVRRPAPLCGVGRITAAAIAVAVLSGACSQISTGDESEASRTSDSAADTSGEAAETDTPETGSDDTDSDGTDSGDTGSDNTGSDNTDSDNTGSGNTATTAGDATSTTVVESAPPTTAPATSSTSRPSGDAQTLIPEIVNTFPHDPTAFTQGLAFNGDELIEGLGEFGKSSRRIVDIETGAVASEVLLPLEQFGTGLTVHDDQVFQLTWQDGRAVVADPATLEATTQFSYDNEGWGLCALDDQLVMSNGTSALAFRDPSTFEVTGTVEVTLNDDPVPNLNELECVDGMVWANVWLTTNIVQIDPGSGVIVAVVDGRSLVPTDQTLGQEDVLNGIAYNAASSTFYVTGKRWNVLYEVRFVAEN